VVELYCKVTIGCHPMARLVQPGVHVLEIGTGSGLLRLLSSVSYSLIYLIIWSFCMRVVWESVL
jgi:hypothetical protein